MKLVLPVALFMFLFVPVLRIGGFVVHLPELYSSALAVIGVTMMARHGVPRYLFWFALTVILGLVYVGGLAVVVGHLDRVLAIQYARALATLPAAYALLRLYDRTYGSSAAERVVTHLFYVGVVHGAVMIGTFVISPLGEALYRVVFLSDVGRMFFDARVRSPGLTGSGGDALAVTQAVCLVLGVARLVFLERRPVLIVGPLYACAIGVLLGSLLLSARTGFVIAALGITVVMVTATIRRNDRPRWALTRFVVAVGFAILMLIPLVLVVGTQYSRAYMRALEPFFALQETGRLRTASSDRIMEMYFLPEGDRVLALGSGNFGRTEGLDYIPSDVGFVRTIHGAGVVGTTVMFTFLLYALLAAVAQARAFFALTIAVAVLSILTANTKVLHLYSFTGSYQLLVMLFVAGMSQPRARAAATRVGAQSSGGMTPEPVRANGSEHQ